MVNWLAVLVTTVASFIIAMLWYGPFFGKAWMRGMKFKKKDLEKGGGPGTMILGFVALFIFHAVLAYIIGWTGVTSFWLGALMAVVVWIAFAMKQLDAVLWEKKALSVYWIAIIFNLLTMAIAGGIFAIW